MTTAVVTGAGSGIGRACALRLARDGMRLVLVDRVAAAVASVTEEVRANGVDAAAIVGDTSVRQTHRDAVTATAGDLGVWVNNAGITRAEPLHEASDDLVGEVIGINAIGYYWGCSAAVADFLGHGSRGAIVNISSIHAHCGFRDHAAYDMSKGAVEALTRNVAATYGPFGIRANAVAPGAVITPALSEAIGDPRSGEQGRILLTGTPARRLGHDHEIADAVAFLASPAAAYVSGQALGVDGGWQAQGVVQPLDPVRSEAYGIDAKTGLPLSGDR